MASCLVPNKKDKKDPQPKVEQKRKLQKLTLMGDGVFLLRESIIKLIGYFNTSEDEGDCINEEDIEVLARGRRVIEISFWSKDKEFEKVIKVVSEIYDVKISGN